ncbi:hypothetical protein [Polaromonas sp.]|uniref:hypothetical protein n=1 Tax=Polaromonas sp. TaxID=1869339 RepID=UPI003751661A
MAKKQAAEGIKARVLVDCEFGKVNDIAIFETAEAAAAAASQVDAHPDAVAYAESLAEPAADPEA